MKNNDHSTKMNQQKHPTQKASTSTQSKVVSISTFQHKKSQSAKRETVEKLARYADSLDW